MKSFINLLFWCAASAQDTAGNMTYDLPITFLSEIIVEAQSPLESSEYLISSGRRRGEGACFMTDRAFKRNDTEFFVLTGKRTNSMFSNDCLTWTFVKEYSLFEDEDLYSIMLPISIGGLHNPGYLALQYSQSNDTVGRSYALSGGDPLYGFKLSISWDKKTVWKLHPDGPGYRLEAFEDGVATGFQAISDGADRWINAGETLTWAFGFKPNYKCYSCSTRYSTIYRIDPMAANMLLAATTSMVSAVLTYW